MNCATAESPWVPLKTIVYRSSPSIQPDYEASNPMLCYLQKPNKFGLDGESYRPYRPSTWKETDVSTCSNPTL